LSKLRNLEDKKIPEWLDYGSIRAFAPSPAKAYPKIRPQRWVKPPISGVSPADVSLVMIWMSAAPMDPNLIPNLI